MEKEELHRIALEWIIRGDHAPVPMVWQDRIADVCADFAQMLYGELMRRESAYRKMAEDALNVRPTPPFIHSGASNP